MTRATLLLLACAMMNTSVKAQDTLTPAQLQDDFDYMMEQYERIHPNRIYVSLPHSGLTFYRASA